MSHWCFVTRRIKTVCDVLQVQNMFTKYINLGVLEVISPPAEFYPNLTALRPSLGDEPERVQWRSKQVILDPQQLLINIQSSLLNILL